MSGINHVSVGVNDVARAKAFYDPLMQILGLHVVQTDDESVDYGTDYGLVFSLETPRTSNPPPPATAFTLLSMHPIGKR